MTLIPDPQWFADAARAAVEAYGFIYDDGSEMGEEADHDARYILRAALPFLRAGIEAELREKLAAEINAEILRTHAVYDLHANGMDTAIAIVRGKP